MTGKLIRLVATLCLMLSGGSLAVATGDTITAQLVVAQQDGEPGTDTSKPKPGEEEEEPDC